MVQKKYRALYSSKSPGKSGPIGPDQELIRLVLDIKHRNPRMGYDRIAMQVLQAFGVEVDKHVYDVFWLSTTNRSIPAALRGSHF